MIDESDIERDSQFSQGTHRCAALLSVGIGMENGGFVPIAKDAIGELADAPRDGEALLRILQAIIGPSAPSNDSEAIGIRAEELLRQLDPSHEIPPWRMRSKQTRSAAGKKVFERLGIDRIPTGRSRPAQARKHMSESVTDWWAKKKPDAANAGPEVNDSNQPQPEASQL